MFDGKKIIITGGSSGVGKKLAHLLIKKGAHLALIARDGKKLLAVRKELSAPASTGQMIEIFPCDVADSNAVEKTFKRIIEKNGIPDILINSAGILREGYFENQSLETFREVMDINFFGTLHCTQSVLSYFKDNGGGRIVNICSVAGLMGVFGYSAYCASKHAVTGLTASLRTELKHQNITFHIVYPPEFDSPMVDEINTCRSEENRMITKTIPKLSADKVADEIIKGIGKNQYEITPGIATRIAARADKLFPSIGRAVVDFKISRVYKGPGNKNH